MIVIGLCEEHAEEFSMCAGSRLEGEAVHAGDGTEHMFEFVEELEVSLYGGFILVRVCLGEVVPHGDFIVEFWVVFHGAATEGVDAGFDAVIHLAEMYEMSDDLCFIEVGYVYGLLSL